MKEKVLVFKVEENNTLSEELKKNLTRKFYRHLKFINATIMVNGEPKRLYEKVFIGDEIKISYKEEEKEFNWPKANKLPKVVFENEHYLIVDKEPDLLTIPTRGNPNSLYQQLVLYLGINYIHILNRLDKETSGLVVVAKDRYARSLLEPTHEHMVRKYLCLVEGKVMKSGRIENFIKKSEDSNKRYIAEDGQLAISNYNVIEVFDDSTLLEFILETGRTHQIRLHSSNMGHPIIGDTIYGNGKGEQLCLTSYSVEFVDPFTKELVKCEIEKRW